MTPLLDDGAAGLARMTEILPGRLAAEREAIAEQDALDAIEAGDRAGEFASAMKDIENTWLQIEHSTEGPALRRAGESPVPPSSRPEG